MPGWLELVNTFINLQTMSRVGAVAQVQQEMNAQILSSELRKQRDNALLSTLVDTLVNVRRFIRDEQYFDAIITAGYGNIFFKEIYPQIIDADVKLKAADIQGSLVSHIKNIALDETPARRVEEELAQFIIALLERIQQASEDLRSVARHRIQVGPDMTWRLEVGDELMAAERIIDPETRSLLFEKQRVYKALAVDGKSGKWFVIQDELGQQRAIYLLENKTVANQFVFFHPSLPCIDKEMSGWKLISTFFSDEFLHENLRSLHPHIHTLGVNGFNRAGKTEDEIRSKVKAHFEIKSKLIDRLLAEPKRLERPLSVSDKATRWLIIGSGILIILYAAILRSC